MLISNDVSAPSWDHSSVQDVIPAVFCWSKMGTEAGQSLEAILRRKELERQAGDGMFAWGIGNSVAPAIAFARRTGWKDIEALFTPMHSAAKPQDIAPSSVVLWLAYLAGNGTTRDLPAHVVVTSRESGASGQAKRAHFALLCHTSDSLQRTRADTFIDRACTRNVVSENPVGASQVTAVVSYRPGANGASSKRYPVAFRARLVDEGIVRLAHPVRLEAELAVLFGHAREAKTREEWEDRIVRLKAVSRRVASHHVQRSLLEID